MDRTVGMGLTAWFWVLLWDLGAVDVLRVRFGYDGSLVHLQPFINDVLMLWCEGSTADVELDPLSTWKCSLSSAMFIAMTLDMSWCIPAIPKNS